MKVRKWLELAETTDAERWANRPLWSNGLDEVHPAESLRQAKERYWPHDWLEFEGIVVRWGNSELAEALEYRALLQGHGFLQPPLPTLLKGWVVRIIMPNGSVCDTQIIDNIQARQLMREGCFSRGWGSNRGINFDPHPEGPPWVIILSPCVVQVLAVSEPAVA